MTKYITEVQAKASGIDVDICGDWLYLVPGGEVIYRRWRSATYDEQDNVIEEAHQEYGVVDEDNMWRHLFEFIKVAPGVKVVDVFKFTLAHPSLFPVIGPVFKQYCMDGINNLIPAAELLKDEEPYPLEYMELYRVVEIGDDVTYRYSTEGGVTAPKQMIYDRIPDFHGVAYPLEKEDEDTGFPKGYRVNCDIGLLPACKYADLPFVINEDYSMYDVERFENNKVLEATKPYTLIEMLKGMFWDMTWYGNVYAE